MYDDTVATARPQPAIAYSYLRLSSKRQANTDERARYRDGFRRQIELRDRYLEAHPHLTLDTTFRLHDIGVSGFTNANAAKGGQGKLAAFLAEVEAGRIEKGSHLLVESLDRMTRQQVGRAQALLLMLVNAGVVVVSLVDNQTYRDTRDASQFIISIMNLSRAHEESSIKSVRLRMTWEQKRRAIADRPLSGRCPSWLRLVDGTFEPIVERVAIVHEILGLLIDGMGRDGIAKVLNQRGEKPWGTGNQWHGGTVQKVTDNRALIGEFQPHRLVYEEKAGIMVSRRVPTGETVPDYFPRVVDDDLWVKARAVADKRRLGKARNYGGPQGTVITNLFGALARCSACGRQMNHRDRGPRSHAVLRCSGNRGGTCTNEYRYYYQDNENAILSWLVMLDLSGGAKGEAAKVDDDLRTEVARREALQVRGETIVREIGVGSRFAALPLAEIEEEMRRVDVRIAELRARATALRVTTGGDGHRMAVAHLIRLHRENASVEEVATARRRTRQVIRDTFESMWCNMDGSIDIFTIDGAAHQFRDGYWFCEEHGERGNWLPWVGSMVGGGYAADKAELQRRRVWLEDWNLRHYGRKQL